MEPIEAVEVRGILPEKTRDLLEAYPNEYFSFMAVFLMFHDLEYQRGIDARYDLKSPPMHFKYYRAMTHYLARSRIEGEGQASVTYQDLYMILKTFDLTVMKTNYTPKAGG